MTHPVRFSFSGSSCVIEQSAARLADLLGVITIDAGTNSISGNDMRRALSWHIEAHCSTLTAWIHEPSASSTPYTAMSRFTDSRGTKFVVATGPISAGRLTTVVLGHHRGDQPEGSDIWIREAPRFSGEFVGDASEDKE